MSRNYRRDVTVETLTANHPRGTDLEMMKAAQEQRWRKPLSVSQRGSYYDTPANPNPTGMAATYGQPRGVEPMADEEFDDFGPTVSMSSGERDKAPSMLDQIRSQAQERDAGRARRPLALSKRR